jgi:hypothetical protein
MNFESSESRLITNLSRVVVKMLCRRGKYVFERYCLVDIGGCGSLTIAVVWASIESLLCVRDGENLTMLKEAEFLYL